MGYFPTSQHRDCSYQRHTKEQSMATYLIGYDLNKEKNYPDLIDAIKALSGTWWHHLDSTWIVVTDKSAVEIRDALRKHIDDDDELLVVKSGGEGAWAGFNDKGSKWLKDNL
jgi:hypothetical protein